MHLHYPLPVFYTVGQKCPTLHIFIKLTVYYFAHWEDALTAIFEHVFEHANRPRVQKTPVNLLT